MLPDTEQFSVVLRGSWNVGLFTPQWTSRHLFKEAAPELELALTAQGSAVRHRSGPLFLFPQPSRLTVGLLADPISNWKACLDCALLISSILTHTPVTALGINFGFITAATTSLSRALNLPDTSALIGAECKVRSTKVNRMLQTQTDNTLNLGLLLREDGSVSIDANFHYDVVDIKAIPDLLSKAKNPDLLEELLGILHTAYDLTITEESEHEADE